MGFGGVVASIIITVVAVIILSSLGRIAQSLQNRVERRPNRKEEDAAAPKPRRTTTEVDRFLEEINRRRQKAAQQRQEPALSRTVEMPPPLPQSWPAPREVPPALPAVRRPAVRDRAEPIERRVEMPVSEVVAVALPVAAVVPPPSSQAPATPAAVVARKAVPPAVKQLTELLRGKQSLQTAILLKELFEPPVSRRGRRR